MKTKFFFSLAVILVMANSVFSQNGVKTYNAVPNNPSYFRFQARTSLAIDNNGNKYVGYATILSGSAKLTKFNDTTWQVMPYSLGAAKVYALSVDASNNLWVGTDMGLFEFHDTTFITSYDTSNSSIISNTITCLDAGGGNVYVGTHKGLSVFNGSAFTNFNHATNGMTSDTVMCVKYESSSAVWIGNKKGLDKFNGSSAFTYSNVIGTQTDSVLCVYIDGTNNKWIGTNHSGVIKYDNTNFYTMPQLYGYPIGVNWPVHTASICKGEGAAVLFQSTHAYQPVSTIGQSVIQIYYSGQVRAYQNVGTSFNSGASWTSWDIFQYDNARHKVYYADINSSSNSFLHSFDASGYYNFYPNSYTSDNLDINGVQALINPNADMGWDMQSTKYFVPKGGNSSPLRAMSLWMGGYVNSGLRCGAMTYRQNGFDFWPGPLDTTNASIDTATSLQYEHVWKVNRFDIANFIYNWGAGNVQNGTFIVPPSILNWPAHGTGNYSRNLAPFVDVNGNGTYDPQNDGDYPLIKGDQMIWWVFNDKLASHSETGGAQMGVQVKASAYAYVCPNIADSNRILNYTTFYDYKITNYSTDKLDSFYIAPWLETDLGNYQDDYVGCNVMGNYGFVYNGDNYDEDANGITGYHDKLPSLSCNILNGPVGDTSDGIDNNNNGVIDEPNEKCLMYSFMSSINNNCPSGCGNPSPNSPIQYYNLMNGHWNNGSPLIYGGNGASSAGSVCRHVYPGNSDPYGISLGGSIASPVTPSGSYGSTGWTQPQAGVVKNDMRFIMGVGPFTMQPHGTYEVEFALAFSQDSASCTADNTCILTRQARENNQIRNWYANNSFPSCLSLNGVGVKENGILDATVKLYPNPASDYLYIEFGENKSKVTVEVYDMLGNIVKAGTFNDERKYIALPVSDLATGMYMTKISKAGASVTKKFVKE